VEKDYSWFVRGSAPVIIILPPPATSISSPLHADDPTGCSLTRSTHTDSGLGHGSAAKNVHDVEYRTLAVALRELRSGMVTWSAGNKTHRHLVLLTQQQGLVENQSGRQKSR
jgi:hypothetical protein